MKDTKRRVKTSQSRLSGDYSQASRWFDIHIVKFLNYNIGIIIITSDRIASQKLGCGHFKSG